MPMTNAERQRRYRQRRHDACDGDRLSMVVSVHAKRALERIARRNGKTQRAALENLLRQADRALADEAESIREYYDGPLPRNGDQTAQRQPQEKPQPAVRLRRPRNGEKAFTGEWDWVAVVDDEPLLGLQRAEPQGWRGRYLKPSMTWRWCKRHRRADVVADLLASADVYE